MTRDTNSIRALMLGLGLAALFGLSDIASAQETADPKPQGAATAEREKSSEQWRTLLALSKEGFEVKATAFVPSEAATRQVGRSTPDAIVLTMQRGSSIAICYHTLNAFVNDELPTLENCLLHE